MRLTITSATKDLFGLWEVSTRINGHVYEYETDDYTYNKAINFYWKGHMGRALNALKGGECENIK